ncbi:MAG: beta-N-acetylhexosaminidase [Deltaproteobacteria bacterium]|nr:beta-N-acetylhexosaminidase [Deltaproteobacteria bacterium]NIS77430.1 beta-N-acetylhexosaminidase [Deltaproteobacteria bacterium]
MKNPVSIGERVIFSFKGITLPQYMAKWLTGGLCGGIIFFRDNFESPNQFRSLVSQIFAAAKIAPPLLMIDHEGGRVQRITGSLLPLPSARSLAGRARNDPDFIFNLGVRVGKSLRRLGLNVNAAPVLDVLTEPLNRVIGDRSYGNSSRDVSRLGIGFARGLIEGRICPVVKHFPGHGMTREDSHETLPFVEVSPDEIMSVHAAPFVDAAKEGLPAVMTAHVLYRELDKDLPATLSKTIVKDILRTRIGFAGAVISDDLAMKAISSRFSSDEIACLTAESSTDILIHCGEKDDQEELLGSLTSFYQQKDFERSGLKDIHQRTAWFRKYVSRLSSV